MILLQQAGGEEGGGVADGVGGEAGLVGEFVGQGQHLPEERVGRVAFGHAGDIGPRGKQGELLGGRLGRLYQIRREVQGRQGVGPGRGRRV